MNAFGVFILPFIEQGNLQGLYHLEVWSADPLNQKVVDHPLKIFQCPSAPEQNRFYADWPFNTTSPPGRGACGDHPPAR